MAGIFARGGEEHDAAANGRATKTPADRDVTFADFLIAVEDLTS